MTLTQATSAAIAASTSIAFFTGQTAVSASSLFVDKGDESIYGVSNHGGTVNVGATALNGQCIYQTVDQVTNYLETCAVWSGSTFTFNELACGSQNVFHSYSFQFGGTTVAAVNNFSPFIDLGTGLTVSGANVIGAQVTVGSSASSGVSRTFLIAPTYNESSTAGYSALTINPTETATGSGAKNLIEAYVGAGSDLYAVDHSGNETVAGSITNSGITADTGKTDASVCEDTTVHKFYSGTGTLGICLGTSSLRYKHDIQPLPWFSALWKVMSARPVSYFYNAGHGDGGRRIQYGFVAEWMQEAFPELVGRDSIGRPNSFDMFGMFAWLVRGFQAMFWILALLLAWNAVLTVRVIRK